MARTLPDAVQQYGGTTAQISAYTGKAREIVVDITKNTLVVQDGTTAGGHALALEARKLKAGTGILLNGASSDVTLGADITLSVDNSALGADAMVKSDDKILTTVEVGGKKKIASGLSLAYNTTTGVFNLLGHDGTTVVSTVTVPSSVSMLQNAVIVDERPADTGAGETNPVNGTFIKFTWLLADNTTKDMYMDASAFIDIYTGGDGVAVTSKTITLKLGTGLKFDNSGNVVPDYSNMISTKAGNALQVADTDEKFYFPLDLGTMD